MLNSPLNAVDPSEYFVEWLLLIISINDFLKDYMKPLFWVKQLAFYNLPETAVLRPSNFQSLFYFPVRLSTSKVVVSGLFLEKQKV